MQQLAPFGTTSIRKASVTDLSPNSLLRKGSVPDSPTSPGLRTSNLPPTTPEPRSNGSHSSTSPVAPSYAPGLPGPGSVALNRALVSDEGSALESLEHPDNLDRRGSETRASNGAARLSAENPFFGSGASRERMKNSVASAASGSGKVISGLQSDLLQARSALESTRGQLRLSQRAVDFLGRQNDDLKETKERLTAEIEGLNRALARKERLQEEALGRARVAEGSLATLQQTHRTAVTSHKSRVKELEEGKLGSDEARAKAESEYGALSRGMKSMSDGWRADLNWLKSDLAKSDAKLAAATASLTRLMNGRDTAHSDVDAALEVLQGSQREFMAQYGLITSSALSDLKDVKTRTDQDLATATDLSGEFQRLRRLMREHAQEEQTQVDGAG